MIGVTGDLDPEGSKYLVSKLVGLYELVDGPRGEKMQMVRYSMRAVALLAFALCFACLALPHSAMAAPDSVESSDTAMQEIDKSTFKMFGDMVSAGEAIDITKQDVPSNLIAAARSIKVSNGQIGSDAFLAGADVTISNTTIGNNLFAAGETITTDANVAGAISAAGKTVHLGGTARAANAAAGTVTIDGVFTGDVNVQGNRVIIADDAVVKGTLSVTADEEPSIPAGADIADMKFTKSEKNSSDVDAAGAGAALAAFLASMSLIFMVLGIVCSILMAVIMLACATDRPFVDAGNALRNRPARILLTGLVVMLIMPIAIIALFCLGVGWEIALALLLACGVIAMLCDVFSALAIGFIAFKKMNRWGAGILMTLIFAIVGVIPFVGPILGFFCSMYMVGYVCTKYLDWRKGKKVQNREGEFAQTQEIPQMQQPAQPFNAQEPVQQAQPTVADTQPVAAQAAEATVPLESVPEQADPGTSQTTAPSEGE